MLGEESDWLRQSGCWQEENGSFQLGKFNNEQGYLQSCGQGVGKHKGFAVPRPEWERVTEIQREKERDKDRKDTHTHTHMRIVWKGQPHWSHGLELRDAASLQGPHREEEWEGCEYSSLVFFPSSLLPGPKWQKLIWNPEERWWGTYRPVFRTQQSGEEWEQMHRNKQKPSPRLLVLFFQTLGFLSATKIPCLILYCFSSSSTFN